MKVKNKAGFYIKMAIWVIAATYLVLFLFSKELFGENSILAQALGDSDGGFAAIGNMVQGKLPLLFKTVAQVIMIMAVSRTIRFICSRIIQNQKSKQRKLTIVKLLDNFVKYVSSIYIVFLILVLLGFDASTIVASAGILTLVVGLGAQALISDIISGLFIMFEGDYNVGDIVVIGDWRGTVQSIGIRTTKIVDAGGNVKIVNNSTIGDIVNMTSELSLAVCDVGVEYGESIERVEKVIMDNLSKIRERIPAIVEGPYYKGVSELGDSSVVIKIIANCKEEDKYQVQRDLNREIKITFDKNNINIPFPQVVINKPISFDDVSDRTRKAANAFVDEQRVLSKDLEDEK